MLAEISVHARAKEVPVLGIDSPTAVLFGLAASFLAFHLAFLPTTPATIDGVNFLLGIRDFNVVEHRPHPPGYPVFILLGKLANSLFARLWSTDLLRAGTWSLAIWGALLGAVAVIPLFAFFRSLESNDRRAAAATALTVTCPLFWFTAHRATSDIPGLVVATAVQALTFAAFRGSERRHLMMLCSAFAAGFAIGIRSQSVWLTVPPLMWVGAMYRIRPRDGAQLAVAFAAGLSTWMIPLVALTGGPTAYLGAFGAQTAHDLIGADLLATNLTLGRLAQGLLHTFAYPWAERPIVAIVVPLALVGAGMMLRYSRPGVMLLVCATVPYGLFHLFYQESFHTRYALPLVPAVAYLATRGLDAITLKGMPWLVAALSIVGVTGASISAANYARTGNPVFHALEDLERAASRRATQPVLAAHHGLSRMLRARETTLTRLESPSPGYEWLDLVEHWEAAPDRPVWFLAEKGRTDLALIDPRSRRIVRSYGWTFPRKFLMGRMPSAGVDWYEMQPPRWMAREGWSLSHETAGIAAKDGWMSGERPLKALVRSLHDAAILMVGGRNLSGADGPPARFTLTVRGRTLDSWDVRPEDGGGFLRMWHLPAGSLAHTEPYAPLEIQTAPIGSARGRSLAVAVDQFDLQPMDSIVHGFDSGWYQAEFDGAAPGPWRWTSASARLRIHSSAQTLILHLTAEVPIDHLNGAPEITVRAGPQVLARVRPRERNLAFAVRVPAGALIECSGFVTIETDRTFVPDQVLGNGDLRRLGLRVYRVDLVPEKDPL